MIYFKKISNRVLGTISILAVFFCLAGCSNTANVSTKNIEQFLKTYYTVTEEDLANFVHFHDSSNSFSSFKESDEEGFFDSYVAYVENLQKKLEPYASTEVIDELVSKRLVERPANSAALLDSTIEVINITIDPAKDLEGDSENTYYPYTVTLSLVASDGTKIEKEETGECAIKTDDSSALVVAFNPSSGYSLLFGQK